MADSEADLVRGDLEWGTVPNLLRAASRTWGARPAIVDGDVTLSYDELRRRADGMARSFIAAGVQPGDRVAIWAPNIWEWPVMLLGLQSAGAAVVPLNTRYKGLEAAHILNSSRARILVTVEGFLGFDYASMLRACGTPLPHLEHIVVIRGEKPEGCLGLDAFAALGESISLAKVDERVASLEPDSMADLLYTSGTTGAPKGVVCTHGQAVRGYSDWASVVGLRSEDRYLVVNPFFHVFGYKAGIIAALTKGATLYPFAVFDVPGVMAAVEAHRISMLPGPPTLFHSMLTHPDLDPAKVSSLRLAVTGAAIVPVQLVRDMHDVLGFETVITGYGLTEACGIVAMCRHDDDPETIAHFSGRAIPGVEMRTVDHLDRPLPALEPGEVVVRGYNVMKGYFEDPDRTAEAIDADGWLHTGDVGVIDERGYVRITDRKKDMYISGGFNAYPAEIEGLLLAHPAVAQVAVVGVPDERMGEVGVAFVVAAPGSRLTPEELRSWARSNMANYKVPASVELVDSLPMNASGKVLKFELRDRARAAPGTPAGGN